MHALSLSTPFQVLNSHTWPMATIPDSGSLEAQQVIRTKTEPTHDTDFIY